MEPVIIDAGTLTFSEEDMTATGLLIPFGVEARSNLGAFTFAPGDVTIPADFTGMSLNIEHRREDVAGGFTRAWETPAGVMATFKYADTPTGRQAFADGKSGKRACLSAEVANVRIRDRKALPGAVLFAGAQVERPAFAGATLLAAEDTPADLLAPDQQSTDPEHLLVDADALPDDITVTTPAGDTATYTPDADPAEENPNTEGGSTVTATATEPGQTAPAAALPGTLLAGAPTAPAPTSTKEKEIDLGSIFAAMQSLRDGGGDRDAAETLLAALSDIKVEAAGGLTGANSGVLQPAWVGRLWQGRRYVRKYLDLASHFYGGIQLGGRKGFKLDQGTALVTAWAGNKTDIGSGTGTTSVFGSTRRAYGWAADIAREWFDLEGGAEVIQALIEGVIDSYAKITDEDALKDIFTAASKTSAALDRLVAPATLPAGTPANSQYYPAYVQLIQAIEAISDANDTPAFAVVNPVAWAQLLYTPKELLPEFVSLSLTAGTGEANLDGKVKVVKAPQSFFPGTTPTNPQVIAGAKSAIEFREQGQTPIQLDALDIARGGVDKAVIGYMETFVVRPESLVLIGTKP